MDEAGLGGEAHYKIPLDVVIAAAALPRNANAKIQKAVLRERAAMLGECAR